MKKYLIPTAILFGLYILASIVGSFGWAFIMGLIIVMVVPILAICTIGEWFD
jgi:hypothetical protein